MDARSSRDSALPLVSIGLPVYNGERHLSQALDSMLSQTFCDFELIISDNASTDATQAVCQKFVRADRRVRYLRHARNIGAPRNWSSVVHEARGQYFKWASANDYCSETFVADCLQALMSDPRAVLTFGSTFLIDEETGSSTEYDGDIEILDDRPHDRFKRVCCALRLNNAQSGLIRLDVLRRTGLDRPYQGGDLVLMAELALYGCFKRVPGVRLFRRVGAKSLSARLSPVELQHFIDPEAAPGTGSRLWKRHVDHIGAILHAPIGMAEKLACVPIAAHNAYWDGSRLAAGVSRRIRARIGISTHPD